MNRTRIALLGLAAVLVAVWSFAMLPPTAAPAPGSSPGPAAQQPAKPARDAHPRSPAKPRDVTSFDLNEAAERLHTRLSASSQPVTPERNPFEFGPPPTVRRAEPVAIPVALPVVPPGPVPPPFSLTGIAEHKNGDTLERTAILTGTNPGEIYFAKPGEQVLGRYDVTAVGADAIELREVATGQIVRLGLR